MVRSSYRVTYYRFTLVFFPLNVTPKFRILFILEPTYEASSDDLIEFHRNQIETRTLRVHWPSVYWNSLVMGAYGVKFVPILFFSHAANVIDNLVKVKNNHISTLGLLCRNVNTYVFVNIFATWPHAPLCLKWGK